MFIKQGYNVGYIYILFGFVGSNGIIDVLNYCILYAKYYIYIQRLFNQNKRDVYALPDPSQKYLNNRATDKHQH